jgi:peptidyl-prolyl cis-trans isomerase SurA
MIKSFEDVGFALENEGDFSKPFESEYGWHILKLLKKYPIGSYEELHAKLESKVKNGSRSSYVERSLAQKVAKDYQVVTYKAKLRLYPNIIGFENSKDTLLRVEDEMFSGHDFYSFAKDFKDRTKEDLFDDFRNKMIIDYYKDHLDETNKEFALTYQEYKDGLLLFELLQKQVWEKSEKDSLGLQRYFDKNRSKYNWKRRADLVIASCTRLEKAKIVQSLLMEGKQPDTIKSMVNEGATIHVLFSKGKLEEGSSKLPDGFTFKPGVSQIFEEEAHHFTIINVTDIFEPQPKELKETRGEVMNDYQNYLESQWVKDLRQRYKIKVNQNNYKELKQRFSTQ